MAPTLPAELIHDILVLSLPEHQPFEPPGERCRLLANYALGCRAWRSWAQTELYRHVSLRGEDAVVRWKQAGAHLADRVVSLCVQGRSSHAEVEGLDHLLKSCTALQRLRLNFMDVTLETLASAPSERGRSWTFLQKADPLPCPSDVEQLFLQTVSLDFEPVPTPFLLPRLRRLFLVEMPAYLEIDVWAPFLNPTSLPLLRSLAYEENERYDYEDRDEVLAASFAAVGPQLETLSFWTTLSDFAEDLEPHLPSFISLKSLSFALDFTTNDHRLLDSFLRALPSSLERLRLTSIPHNRRDCHAAGLHEFVTTLRTAMEGHTSQVVELLRRLDLPAHFRICGECEDDELLPEIKEGLRYLQGRMKMRWPTLSNARIDEVEEDYDIGWPTWLDEG